MIAALFIGVHLRTGSETETSVTECLLENNICEFTTANGLSKVQFQQTPGVEKELAIVFNFEGEYSVQNAYIKGRNMYMGKIPVLFDNEVERKKAKTYLPSCHIEQMQWEMHIEVLSEAGHTEYLRVLFATLQ